MTARILAVYDRSSLGDLAIETAFQLARAHVAAVLHVLAVPTVEVLDAPNAVGSASQHEQLTDDLIAFTRLGQRFGVAVDGAIIDEPNVERFVSEIHQRQIDRFVIAHPERASTITLIGRMLDAVAATVGVATTVVYEGHR